MHDQLQMMMSSINRQTKGGAGHQSAKAKPVRRIGTLIFAGAVMTGSAVLAADRDPIFEMAQAECIQQGMLAGVVGEALKNYVNTCAEKKRNSLLREPGQFLSDPAAC